MASQRTGGNPWESLTGPNFAYLLEKYEEYMKDPETVEEDVRDLFDNWGGPEQNEVAAATMTAGSQATAAFSMKKVMSAVKLVENIRTYGHLSADIYPLIKERKEDSLLNLHTYGLTEADLKAIPASLLCENAPEDVKDGFQAIKYLK